ncbi:MAG TPA: Do family serine endopeptidase, partial [Vicinamibacteria bacterium]
FFERFFRDQPDQRRRSLGSGVIIDARGYVVTNNHVVENADEIEIQFSDERRFSAEVVGTDPPTDLAVLKVESDGTESFPHVEFGDSDAVVVGEWVLAMGNPFGFGHTVTAGIVSAKGRLINQSAYDDFIQTDAAINPGNSGGPLVNMRGQIVGINSNIISNSGGNMGIGFAIPSNMARKIYDQLVASGTVTRGWLGVGIQPLSAELARSFGIEGKHGALISEVLGEDSPAAKAGLKAGDVIVELNGRPVDSNTHLVHLVADLRPGDTVDLKYYREGRLASTKVTVAKRTVEEALVAPPEELQGEKGRLGISGQNLTSQLASEIGATSKAGVVLVEVDPDGPAEEAGLRRGDILIEANRQPVRTVDDLQRILAAVPAGGDLLLRVERVIAGRSTFTWVPVTLD